MVQTTYGYNTPIGQAGGLYDLSPVKIDAFINEAATGALKFGMGCVQGTLVGNGVTVPVAASTATKFEGIVVNRRTTENDDEGVPVLKNKRTVGVLRYGRIYGLLAEGAEPEYGGAVYLMVKGDEAGCFTDSAGTNSDAILIKGAKFLSGPVDGLAVIDLLDQEHA